MIKETDIKKGFIFYMNSNRDPRKYHIVEIIKDKPKNQVVYKYFGIHKKWWHYEIQELELFIRYFDSGLYSTTRIKWK